MSLKKKAPIHQTPNSQLKSSYLAPCQFPPPNSVKQEIPSQPTPGSKIHQSYSCALIKISSINFYICIVPVNNQHQLITSAIVTRIVTHQPAWYPTSNTGAWCRDQWPVPSSSACYPRCSQPGRHGAKKRAGIKWQSSRRITWGKMFLRIWSGCKKMFPFWRNDFELFFVWFFEQFLSTSCSSYHSASFHPHSLGGQNISKYGLPKKGGIHGVDGCQHLGGRSIPQWTVEKDSSARGLG